MNERPETSCFIRNFAVFFFCGTSIVETMRFAAIEALVVDRCALSTTMSIIGDIVTVAKEIEGRARDRKDLDALRQIHSLALSLQKQHADIVDRADKIQVENARLKRQLAEANAEEVRVHSGIEFRKGKRTGNVWQPFCPKCKIPATHGNMPSGQLVVICPTECAWKVLPEISLEAILAELVA